MKKYDWWIVIASIVLVVTAMIPCGWYENRLEPENLVRTVDLSPDNHLSEEDVTYFRIHINSFMILNTVLDAYTRKLPAEARQKEVTLIVYSRKTPADHEKLFSMIKRFLPQGKFRYLHFDEMGQPDPPFPFIEIRNMGGGPAMGCRVEDGGQWNPASNTGPWSYSFTTNGIGNTYYLCCIRPGVRPTARR